MPPPLSTVKELFAGVCVHLLWFLIFLLVSKCAYVIMALLDLSSVPISSCVISFPGQRS